MHLMGTVVIGGGVFVASAAYHLARAGAQVTVSDTCLLGRATTAGAGIVCPWVTGVDDPVFYRLYTEAARYYADLVPALGEIGEHDLARISHTNWVHRGPESSKVLLQQSLTAKQSNRGKTPGAVAFRAC